MEEPADLNPYAPSAVALSDNPLAAVGVGCWRHGTLLVVHEDAELPPICVKTGGEAVAYRPSPLRWTHVLQWPPEYIEVAVPLSARPLFWVSNGRKILLAIATASLLAVVAGTIVAATRGVGSLPGDIANGVFLAGIAIVMLLFIVAGLVLQPLRIFRRQRRYYWLSGAHARFLNQLPPWPLG